MKNVVFLGSKQLGAKCLQYLLQQSDALCLKVIAVATRQHTALDGEETVASIAARHSIPVLNSLEALPACQLIYSVQYHVLLKADHIAKASEMSLNLHLAPLPEYRGCNQFSFAIMEEATEFGVSIHQLDAEIDHGTLFWEKRFVIPKDIWVEDLVARANIEAYVLFIESLPLIALGDYNEIDTTGRSSSIHYRKEIQDLKRLSLAMPQAEIEKSIRATAMPGFEPPYFLVGGKKVGVMVDK